MIVKVDTEKELNEQRRKTWIKSGIYSYSTFSAAFFEFQAIHKSSGHLSTFLKWKDKKPRVQQCLVLKKRFPVTMLFISRFPKTTPFTNLHCQEAASSTHTHTRVTKSNENSVSKVVLWAKNTKTFNFTLPKCLSTSKKFCHFFCIINISQVYTPALAVLLLSSVCHLFYIIKMMMKHQQRRHGWF